MAMVLANMGRSAFALGIDSEAEHIWCEALRISNETQALLVGLETVVGLANLQAKHGDIEPALEMLLIVLDHPASIQETKNRASQLRAELEDQMTVQKIEAVKRLAAVNTFASLVNDILGQF